jgi:hypothetical protein
LRSGRSRLGGSAIVLGAALAACGGPPATTAVALPPPARPVAVAFPDDPRPLPRFHSARLALSLPLPDGRAWRIDDHSQPELVATHAPTRSRVLIAVLRADELVGRTQCETLAHERRLVPSADLQVLEQEIGVTQESYDTRTLVALDPGVGPDQPLVGHVIAFGGFLRKCFVFDFSTEVDGAANEAVLSSRLAYARARILGGLKLDSFGTVTRASPDKPDPPEKPPAGP